MTRLSRAEAARSLLAAVDLSRRTPGSLLCSSSRSRSARCAQRRAEARFPILFLRMRGYVPRMRDPARARKPATIPSDEIENGSEISSRSSQPSPEEKRKARESGSTVPQLLRARARARIFLVHVAEHEAHLAPSLFRRTGSSRRRPWGTIPSRLFEKRRRPKEERLIGELGKAGASYRATRQGEDDNGRYRARAFISSWRLCRLLRRGAYRGGTNNPVRRPDFRM